MEDMSELLTITEEARAKVLEVRAAEADATDSPSGSR